MHRRAFVVSAMSGLAAAAASVGRVGNAARMGPPAFVSSDFGKLKRVVVHSPGPEVLRPFPGEADPAPWMAHARWSEEAIREHEGFVKALRGQGAEVLEFVDLLDDALNRLRASGRLVPWLERHELGFLDLDGPITAARLIGREEVFAQGDDAALPAPLKCLTFLRDVAVMTPKGLVLTNFLNRDRAHEMDLARLALREAMGTRAYPVVCDAHREGVFLQGGDLVVLDEKTVLLGVGNLTEPAAAPLLARKLEMDVVSVALPGDGLFGHDVDPDRWGPLRTMALHLDSLISLLDPQQAIVAPVLFEAPGPSREARGKTANRLRQIYHPLSDDLAALQRIGWVRTHRARTGAPGRGTRDQKLVDHLKSRDITCVEAGGHSETGVRAKDWCQGVVTELLGQAANVVAVGPGHVVAYTENARTLAALAAAGVKVTAVPGRALARLHGGPHCLTFPLERDAKG